MQHYSKELHLWTKVARKLQGNLCATLDHMSIFHDEYISWLKWSQVVLSGMIIATRVRVFLSYVVRSGESGGE